MKAFNPDRRSLFRRAAGGAAAAPVLGLPLNAWGSPLTTRSPTLEAFVETVIPGNRIDPSGDPGALEAGTLEFLRDVERRRLLPVPLPLVEFAVSYLLNALSMLHHVAPFARLKLEHRERIVHILEGVIGMPLYLRLIRAPFYTAVVNRVGYDYVGYPGPNPGSDDFSFREALSEPHPDSVAGNLP